MSEKRQHSQVYRKEYSVRWPVLCRSMKSTHHVFCSVCHVDFSIAHGGKNDCFRHVEGRRHRQNADLCSSNRNVGMMLKTGDNLNTIKSEALFAKFLIEHNVAADHAGPLFKKMFPDSKIAADYGFLWIFYGSLFY